MQEQQATLLKVISRMIFPFVILFAIYIVLFGDVSPGGGFQGGAILGTCFFVSYLIKGKNFLDLSIVLLIEKIIFLILLFIGLASLYSRLTPFTNPFDLGVNPEVKRIFLMVLNVLISLKVTTGFIAIFSLFIKEGE